MARSRSRRAFRRRSPRVMPLPLLTGRPPWIPLGHRARLMRSGHQARTIAPGGPSASIQSPETSASWATSYYYDRAWLVAGRGEAAAAVAGPEDGLGGLADDRQRCGD